MPSDTPPDKPTRHAVAAALRRVDGLVLAVRRPDEPDEELPNIWGLPAVTLLENETAEEGIRRLGPEKLGIELTPLRHLAEGDQQREHYILHMTVYEASPGGEPTLPPRTAEATVTLYEGLDWLPVQAFNEAAERGSLCCKLFLDFALSPSPSPTSGRGESDEGKPRLLVPVRLKRQMIELARTYRKESTSSEELLWEHLRRKGLDGHKFRRQHPFGPFILDFYCPEKRLAVEVDGPIHADQRAADAERQQLLESAGLKVIRISAEEVENDVDAAIDKIRAALAEGA